MPEPDVSVSFARERYEHPSPRDALLLIEVADSSVAKDRIIKTEIYAEAGVPEYWIVNVKERTIEVLRKPTKTGYQTVVVKGIGERVQALKLRGISFAVADVPWPPQERSKKKKRTRRA